MSDGSGPAGRPPRSRLHRALVYLELAEDRDAPPQDPQRRRTVMSCSAVALALIIAGGLLRPDAPRAGLACTSAGFVLMLPALRAWSQSRRAARERRRRT